MISFGERLACNLCDPSDYVLGWFALTVSARKPAAKRAAASASGPVFPSPEAECVQGASLLVLVLAVVVTGPQVRGLAKVLVLQRVLRAVYPLPTVLSFVCRRAVDLCPQVLLHYPLLHPPGPLVGRRNFVQVHESLILQQQMHTQLLSRRIIISSARNRIISRGYVSSTFIT